MGGLRRFLVAIPFAALVALITHAVRFGNEHDFGLQLHGAIVTTALGGISALGAFWMGRAVLASGEADGTVIAARLRAALPTERAFVLVLWALASAIYFGIEATEPGGDGLNILAFLLAAALSLGLAALIRLSIGAIARAALALAALSIFYGPSRPRHRRRFAPVPIAVSRWEAGGSRFGRAPPG